MIELIQENLDTSIGLVTLLISAIVIFLGLENDKKNKQDQLKFILISYSVIMFIILFYSKLPNFTLLVLLLFFFLGGLSYSTNDDFDLEKELSSFQLLFYSSVSWFFITNNYFLFGSIVITYFLKINYYISLIIICISLVLQYLSIVKDYFGINSYNKTYGRLIGINLDARNKKKANDVLDKNFLVDNLQLVAFVLYVEDRYLFDRKTFHISIKNIFDSKKNPVIFKGKIKFDEKSQFKKYKRGYSTIEQQLIRQYSIAENGYRYKYRRKLFFDWIYTIYFSKALCNRKSRVYGSNKKIAKKELVWSLKVMYLYNYYTNVLDNPQNIDELINNMSKQSRVSVKVYQKMYEIFKGSLEEEKSVEKITINLSRSYNFY